MPDDPNIFDKNDRVSYWWAALCSIPSNRASAAYRRLRRVWFDCTRFRGSDSEPVKGKRKTPTRYHEISNRRDETHLTTTLWENFTLFDCGEWIPKVYAAAGLPPPSSRITRCSWAYEWADKAAGDRMVDVVAEYEDERTERRVFVVEAKALGKVLTEKDLDASYYLEKMTKIAAFGERR